MEFEEPEALKEALEYDGAVSTIHVVLTICQALKSILLGCLYSTVLGLNHF